MYQNLYDKNPRRFYTMSVNLDNVDESSTSIHQKGIREYIFCESCETLLSRYENYAAETIYGKNKRNKAYIVNASETTDQQFFVYDYAGFSYKEYKIFLLSLIYRILISSRFYSPTVSEDKIEKLRAAIQSENPLDFDEFGCVVQVIKYKKNHIAKGFIIDPFLTKNEHSEILNILIDGFMYSYYLDSKNVSDKIKESFLKPDGTMKVIGRVLFQDIGLFNRIKAAFDYFRDSKKVK